MHLTVHSINSQPTPMPTSLSCSSVPALDPNPKLLGSLATYSRQSPRNASHGSDYRAWAWARKESLPTRLRGYRKSPHSLAQSHPTHYSNHNGESSVLSVFASTALSVYLHRCQQATEMEWNRDVLSEEKRTAAPYRDSFCELCKREMVHASPMSSASTGSSLHSCRGRTPWTCLRLLQQLPSHECS